MYINRLTLKNFRNYGYETASFVDGVNILIGDNAQGKTNIIDAIELCSIGKCSRVNRDRELIRWGQDRAKAEVTAVKRYGEDRVEAVLDKSTNKTVSVNGMPLTRLGELMGTVATVMFSPEHMSIVKDSPQQRRRFMDIALCQLSKPYFYLLNRYNRILSQRNKLLKSGRADSEALDVWNIQLVGEGSKIIKTRRGFISRLSQYADAAQDKLSGGRERLRLSYEGIEGEGIDAISERFFAELIRTKESDIKLGFTHTGPQRDDISISINDIDARTYGSQGQQRTAALSLKLAELELYKEQSGYRPVLLLDDVLSELDPSRQRQLINMVKVQTVITCTHIPAEVKSALTEYKPFIINSGKITEA